MADRLIEFLEEELRKSEDEWRQRQELEADRVASAQGYKYNPVISSAPGEPLEVTVDLPDNHTNDQMFEAMAEAAKKLGFEV